MALSITELNAVSKKYFDSKITQGVYESSPFLSLLKEKSRIKKVEGTDLQFPIRYAKLDKAQKTGARTQVVFSGKETRTAGVLAWAFYDAVTMMHWDERVKNRGKGQIIDLLADKAKELTEDMADLLASVVFGTDATGMIPLQTIVDSSSAYAGIDPADATIWKSHEDAATTVLTLAALRYARNQATFGKDMPTHHFTTRELFSKLEGLLQPQERLENKSMAKMGFDSIDLYGKPVVADPFVSAGDWFGLDMDKFSVYRDDGMGPSDWFSLEQAGYPNALARYLSEVTQLKCTSRRSCFKFTALDYTL